MTVSSPDQYYSVGTAPALCKQVVERTVVVSVVSRRYPRVAEVLKCVRSQTEAELRVEFRSRAGWSWSWRRPGSNLKEHKRAE
jgi:hypothetical protein